MASYVAINNSEIDPDSPITADLMTKFRDNPLAIVTDDASVPDSLKIRAYKLLGTIATTSGLTQTLSGLSLTDYTQIYVSVIGVKMASTTSSIIKAGGLTLYTSTFTSLNYTYATLDLTRTTVGFSNSAYQGSHTTTTSSTSISVTSSGAAFSGGSVKIYGVK